MSVKINVKWGKERYTVDVDTSETGLTLKSQLYALTGVPPERQKSTLERWWMGLMLPFCLNLECLVTHF